MVVLPDDQWRPEQREPRAPGHRHGHGEGLAAGPGPPIARDSQPLAARVAPARVTTTLVRSIHNHVLTVLPTALWQGDDADDKPVAITNR